MPKHEPSGRADNGALFAAGKIKLRRDAEGKLVPVLPEPVRHATTEAKPKPPLADDPRPASARNVPPHAAGA
jgi:hypothetical protein